MKTKTFLSVFLWGYLVCLTMPALAHNPLQHQKDSLRRVIEQSEGIDKLRSYNRLYYLYMSEIADDRKMDTLPVSPLWVRRKPKPLSKATQRCRGWYMEISSYPT